MATAQPLVIRSSSTATDEVVVQKSLEELKRQIVSCQQELTELIVGTLLKAIELGQLLLHVRDKLRHGQFLAWVDNELEPTCGVKRRTAQRYMHLARNRKLILSGIKNSTSSGDVIETNASLATTTLRRLKIADGERLIERHKPKTVTATASNRIPARVENALHSFSRRVNGTTQFVRATLPSPQSISQSDEVCLYSVRSVSCNSAAVRELRHSHNSSTNPFSLLWIDGHEMELWFPSLNEFPRLCVSLGEKTSESNRTQWWLFGLVVPSMFETFAAAVCDLGDVLIPYTASTTPQDATLPGKE